VLAVERAEFCGVSKRQTIAVPPPNNSSAGKNNQSHRRFPEGGSNEVSGVLSPKSV
jgi:hypothetical protein